MNEADKRRLQDLFEEGVALAAEDRRTWLAGIDGIDASLRDMLARMLDADLRESRLTARVGAAFARTVATVEPGQRVGAYRVLKEIGRGGAGVVYLAERADDQFRHHVAIKIIDSIAGPDGARQLRHERQLLADLDHPGIAHLLDGGETEDGHPYLVMEHVRGAPISDACRERRLAVRERVRLVRDIARAVQFAHQRLVIHRDIKPGNVLLREDGRPVLLDFGVAKLLGANAGDQTITRPWFTPAYAAPEQRRGEAASAATDIYALGLLLFELLTDTVPAAGERGELAPPSAVAPVARRAELRADLDAIVARACAPDPRDRYASADAFGEDLERWLNDQPVRASAGGTLYVLRKLVRRHPVGTTLALVFATTLAGLGAWLVAERTRALRAETDAVAQSEAAEAVTAFLVDLFREAEPVAGPRKLTAAELIDRGFRRMQSRDDLTPLQRAKLAGVLGQIQLNLGEPTKATTSLAAAVAAARAAGVPPIVLGRYLNDYGAALDTRGRHADAAAVHAEALALFERTGDVEGRMLSLAGVGGALAHQRELGAAEPYLRRALALAREHYGAESIEAAEFESYLVEMLGLARRFDEAKALARRSVETLRRHVPPDDARLLSALMRQGALLSESGDPAAAEQVLADVLAHRSRLLGRDSALLGKVRNALGVAYFYQGRARDAVPQLEEALAIGERTLDAEDPELAAHRYNLAAALEEEGAYADVERLLRQVLALMEARPGEREWEIGLARQTLGRVLMLAGRAQEARELLEAELPAGDGAPFALNRARQRMHLAEWHRRHGDPAESARLLDLVEADVADIGGRDSIRFAFVQRTRGLLALAAGDGEAARATLEATLALMRKHRGPHFIGIGEVELDLAEVELSARAPRRAARHARAARAVFEATLVDAAPQWQRLARVEAALRGAG